MRTKKEFVQQIRYIFCIILCVNVLVVWNCMEVKAESALQLQAEIATYKSVLLEWQAQDTAGLFQIQRKEDGATTYNVLATLPGQSGTVRCYDNDVDMGKKYTYRIVQLVGENMIGSSNEVTIMITLATPSDVKTKIVKQSSVQISWNKVKKATSYTVYRSKKAKSGYKKLVTVKKNRYVDYNVECGKSYYYKVVANYKKKKSWTSPKSGVASAHMKPEKPQVIGSYVKKKVKITWKKVKGASIYYVYKKNKKGSFEKLTETNKLYYRDGDVKKGKTYIYKVVAVRKKDGKLIKSKASTQCKVLAAGIDPNKKMVAITYDDGPSRYTQDILKCLKENQAKATFFVIGCNIDSYKSAVIEAHEMGCEIGNHTYTHPMLYQLSVDGIRREIENTDKKIKKLTGSNAVTMRPPGGGLSNVVERTVGKPIILWSIDTRDWEHRNSTRVINSVMNHVQDGDIILMHDIYQSTRDASLVLIPRLRREGYQLVTVSELAEYRGYKLQKGMVYNRLRKTK